MDARDERLLDAAIVVLGTGGMRRLTHRAVDAAADLPLGSTSNRFRTRDRLLVGVLRRILDRETQAWTTLSAGAPIASTGALAEALGQLVARQVGPDRVLAQARRAIFVEAANHPVLQSEIVRGRAELLGWMGPMLAGLGDRCPARTVEHLLALMEGLIGNRLATAAGHADPVAPIDALLRGLAGDPDARRATARSRPAGRRTRA